MALASAQALLDELMGRDRNLAPTDKKRDLDWRAHDVCKHYLVKFCPNELFVNTKADLGPCNKIHDDGLKKEYERSNRFQQMGYEEEFLHYCQNILTDVDKRIRRAKQRLTLRHQEGKKPTPVFKSSEDEDRVLTNKINDLLSQVEQLGCEGKVEEAQGIMKLCDKLKEERENLRKSSESNHWLQHTAEIAAAQEKQMEVCDVCGAFLIVGDTQQRVDDHLSGKQHVGYAKVKNAVDEILNQHEKVREESCKQRRKEFDVQKRQKEEEEKQSEKRMRRMEEERKQEQKERDQSYRRTQNLERHRPYTLSHSSRRHNKNREKDGSHGSRSSWHRGIERERSKLHSHSRDRIQSCDQVRDVHHSSKKPKNRSHDQDSYYRKRIRIQGRRMTSYSDENDNKSLHSYREGRPSENGDLFIRTKERSATKSISDDECFADSTSMEGSTDD